MQRYHVAVISRSRYAAGVTWEVRYTDQFEEWWDQLGEDAQDAVAARVELLEAFGPSLGRPSVDQITTSRHQNMKELRASSEGSLRVLFAFDPAQEAILLIGGNKTGQWSQWYAEMVPLADDLFDEHLKMLEGRGRN